MYSFLYFASAFLLFSSSRFVVHAEKDFEKMIVDAFNIVDTDEQAFKAVWADDCDFKVCFAGGPGCSQGNYETVFQPFVDALKIYRMKSTHVSGTDEQGSIMKFSGFMETKNGCRALYTGNAYNELNDEGKVIKHISYSDDSQELMNCVGEYFASLEDKKDL